MEIKVGDWVQILHHADPKAFSREIINSIGEVVADVGLGYCYYLVKIPKIGIVEFTKDELSLVDKEMGKAIYGD